MTDRSGPDDPGSDAAAARRRWDMIHRFLDGLSTLPERREVERLMNDDLSVQRYINAHKHVWSMIGRKLGSAPLDSEDAWDSLQDRIAEHERRDRFSLPGRGLEHLRVSDGGLATGAAVRRHFPWRATAAAASLVIVSLASVVAIRHRDDIRARVAHVSLSSAPVVAYAVRRGERPSEQRLPDGTRVVLAPDSRFVFAVDRGAYRVSLTGQAHFSVVHDARRPFIVSAPGVETQDLGTEFDVRSYPGTSPRVAVQSGSVSVRASHGSAVLGGGRIANIDPSTGAVVVNDVKADYFSWTSGRLAFTDTPLRDVADELGRRYDLHVQITDASLAAVPVTLTFSDGTGENALRLLSATVAGLHFEQDGQEVRLFRQ